MLRQVEYMEEIFSTEDIFKQAQALGANAADMNLSIGEAAAERAKKREKAKKEKEEKKAAEKAKVCSGHVAVNIFIISTNDIDSGGCNRNGETASPGGG